MACHFPRLKTATQIGPVAAILLIMTTASVFSADFRPGRGLNMDIWVLWPGEEQWSDPSVILPFPEWRQHVTDDQLRTVRDAGIDTIRMPVDPRPLLSPRTAQLQEKLRASVIESAEKLTGQGFKVIFDLHLIPDGETPHGLFTENDRWAGYLDLVGDFAARLSRFDSSEIAFEPINEPPTICSIDAAPDWQSRMEALYRAIRAEASDLTVVATGGCMGHADGLAALDPSPFDDNTLFTFHSYAPFLLTHQGAGWAGDVAPHVTGLPFPTYGQNEERAKHGLEETLRRVRTDAPLLRRNGIASYIEEEFAKIDTRDELTIEMATPFETVSKWATRNGISAERIFLGEFGMIRQEYDKPDMTDPADRTAYYRRSIELAERYGFGWAMWGWGGAFGIVTAFGDEPAEPNVLDAIRNLPSSEAD
ncbi:glycoside hydrolase family 5 protein [Notoacmeibacter sp. MSK16QG-6]|uniref:glycoside hydrolase family 5 protein n=1 Tax=Notoacmeibacter sp. MSK16QG-6 TaxID=2957982 RepID=UPI00209E3A10|nr:cellulase family glycosylhydrolase [Notoacmeibacter sp. MSK16QG-6]MCP1200120.1 glycoside hydrolase family 5 protein [Notoacmeibacter sp. MSK16QG-6]